MCQEDAFPFLAVISRLMEADLSLWNKVSVGELHPVSGLGINLVSVMEIFIMDLINKTKCALGGGTKQIIYLVHWWHSSI